MRSSQGDKAFIDHVPLLSPVLTESWLDSSQKKKTTVLNCLVLKQTPGHGVASLKESLRAGCGIYCEKARQRSEPYPEAHGSAAKE